MSNKTNLKQIVNRKTADIHAGTFLTNSGCEVQVFDDKGSLWPIRLTIDGNYFGVEDLRQVAKLANRLADVLETQKRGL